MPPPAVPLDLRSVFVSSTINDLREYRDELKDALWEHLTVPAVLSEAWSGGYDDTLQRCRDKLHASDAYFGIFAYWYGSIPPGCEESITQMEFRWAMDRWGTLSAPPIAVFMPEGEAEKELRRKAQALFRKKFRHLSDEERRQKQEMLAERLNAFHVAVRSPVDRWRTLNPFRHRWELRERAVVTCYRWLGRSAPVPAGRAPTDAELGRLGREPHGSAYRRVLRAAAAADTPAVAVLVTGGEDAGQKEFCRWLLGGGSRRQAAGRPSAERYDVSAFVAWCAQALKLALAADTGVETVEALAARIHDELAHQHLTLVVDQVERFPGRVAGFHELFWAPLFAALNARGPVAHRLVVVAAEHTGQPAGWAGHSCPHDAAADFGLLMELPGLGELAEEDVLEWLYDVEVPNDPPGRHRELAALALSTPAGDKDGTPRRVFGRLRNETLWPDEDP
jgi:hypothetical protein